MNEPQLLIYIGNTLIFLPLRGRGGGKFLVDEIILKIGVFPSLDAIIWQLNDNYGNYNYCDGDSFGCSDENVTKKAQSILWLMGVIIIIIIINEYFFQEEI